jgi:TRAP-type mannitol/chloroaromatic compound transport system permease small subunit
VNFLKALAQGIDWVNERIGRVVAWLAILMVLIQIVVVVMRYVFGLSVLVMQESIWYMHSIIFLVGAGYTLLHNGHVRVDILYGNVSPRGRALIDFLGVFVLLIPTCAVVLWAGWPYVKNAWAVKEGSIEISGIQAVYLLKTCMLVFAGTVLLQGISLAIRSLCTLLGIDDGTAPVPAEGDHAP